jgi:hypothetical protein
VPKHDTRSNGPKDGVVAPCQILDADLFRWFPLISKGFWCETNWVGFLIWLAFHPYVGHQKRSLDTSWVTSLRQTGLGARAGLELELDWASTMKKMNWMPMLDLLLSLTCMRWSSDVLIIHHHPWALIAWSHQILGLRDHAWSTLLDPFVLLLPSLPPLRLPSLDGRRWESTGSRMCSKIVQITTVVCLLGSKLNSCLGIEGLRSFVTWECCLPVHNDMLCTSPNPTSVPTPSLWCFG